MRILNLWSYANLTEFAQQLTEANVFDLSALSETPTSSPMTHTLKQILS
jgi:hypothetical protein